MRVSGKVQEWAFIDPLECKSDEHILIHSFLYIPECSLLLLGRDSLHKLGTTIHLIGDKLEMDISLDKVYTVIILMCVCLCLVVSNVCNPTDYNTGSSAHGIFQARILEWVAISFSKVSSQSRDQTHISCIGSQILYHYITWEALIMLMAEDKPPQIEQVNLLGVNLKV